MENNIQRRTTQLFNKKPGALAFQPLKIIWVKMLRRPYNGALQGFNQIMALRNRFNNAMENSLTSATKHQQFIMSIKVEDMDFFPSGSLKGEGEYHFWCEVDTVIKNFNRDKINLKPRSRKSDIERPSITSRRKLPTPPFDRHRMGNQFRF